VNLDDISRIVNKAVGQLADVYQSVLMHADINKRTKCGYVGDDTGQLHPLLKVIHVMDVVRELKCFRLVTGITAGLGQFHHNIPQRWQTTRLRYKVLENNFVSQLRRLNQLFDRTLK
jgi:hypothetical protein